VLTADDTGSLRLDFASDSLRVYRYCGTRWCLLRKVDVRREHRTITH
jgi:hypothetical protein